MTDISNNGIRAVPALRNHNPAARGSLAFTPVFGAVLHSRHWQAPGPRMRLVRLIVAAVALWCLAALVCSANASESTLSDWPETVVVYESLEPLTPFRLRAPGIVAKGRVNGPATLRVHITAEGNVAKVVLMDTCGNPDLDEAALHAMRAMRFKPSTFGGVATDVTLVAPVHVPRQWGRTR